MSGLVPPELKNIRTSSGLSLYPFSDQEERNKFAPLLNSLQQQVAPTPTRKDIHEVIDKAMQEEGRPVEERQFLDKVNHFILLQEAFSYDKNVPFHPVMNHRILHYLSEFNNYYQMSQGEKQLFDEFYKSIERQTDPEGYTFKKSNDPRGEIKRNLDHSLGELSIKENGQFYAELSDFIRALVYTIYPKKFINRLSIYAKDPSLTPDEQRLFTEFTKANEKGEFYFLYEFLKSLKEQPNLKERPESLAKIKEIIWLAKNKSFSRPDSITAHERITANNLFKLDRRAALRESPDLLEDWDIEAGNYGNLNTLLFTSDETKTGLPTKLSEEYEQRSTERPGCTETFLVSRIRQQLEKQKDKPVICVDFGGMMGTSFLRLAEVFKTEVEQGKVALVVTNFAADNSKVDALWRRDAWRHYSWYKGLSKFVHFIPADAQDLQEAIIDTQTSVGKIALKGNVSIIHEFGAISRHGGLNDVDYPLLANVLQEDGLLMTGRTDLYGTPIDSVAEQRFLIKQQNATPLPLNTVTSQRVSEKWGLGPNIPWVDLYANADNARLAVNNLHNEGFKVADAIYDLNNQLRELKYAFWLKPSALPLAIQNFDGRWEQIPETWLK